MEDITLKKTPEQLEHGKQQIALLIQTLTAKMKVTRGAHTSPGRLIDEKQAIEDLRCWRENFELLRKEKETEGCYWMGKTYDNITKHKK